MGFLALLAASLCLGQDFYIDGTRFGITVCTLEDLDGDGFAEFAVGAPYADLGSTYDGPPDRGFPHSVTRGTVVIYGSLPRSRRRWRG